MKVIANFIKAFFILLLAFQLSSCDSVLNEAPYSQLSQSTLNTENGINAVLNSAYGRSSFPDFWGVFAYIHLSGLASGEIWAEGGSAQQNFAPIKNFTWKSTNILLGNIWNPAYEGIRNANIVIANINNDKFSTEFKKEKTAEAKFIRGWCYTQLYYKFGPVPLHKTPNDNPVLPRASVDTMKIFIEKQLIDASNNLPVKQKQFGRATKGAALGMLCKFYLNTKQWKKSAATAQKIISMNTYGLVKNYADVFSLDNEGNKEIIWALTHNVDGIPNILNSLTVPNNYPLPLPTQLTYPATTYLFDSFVNVFKDGDMRKKLIVTEYTSTSGKEIIGLGNNKSFPLKYEYDPNANGIDNGNDIPVIRYADILLSRAEALNELNGPTQESIDLINTIRTRAGVPQLNIGNFDKKSLRNEIFKERKKEFYYEAKGRQDEIRHGTFISSAQQRGLNAKSYQKLFPIPQQEVDANSKLKQNPGY